MLVRSPVPPLLVELVAGGDGRQELLLSAEHWTWRFWEVREALRMSRLSGSAGIEGSISYEDGLSWLRWFVLAHAGALKSVKQALCPSWKCDSAGHLYSNGGC